MRLALVLGLKQRASGPPTLAPLTLSASSASESASVGTVVGAIQGATSGSTVTLTDDALGLFAKNGNNIEVAGALDYETATSHNITLRETLAGATGSPKDTVIAVTVTDVDEVAPTLSSATATETGPTSATIAVTTDEGNGTWYWVVTASSSAPSAAQVKAGQDHTGAAAVDSGSASVSTTGEKTANASGLTAATAYYAHFMHEDLLGNQSSVASSAQFTTNSAGVPSNTLEPVISGTPAQTLTLSVTDGTWTGSPSGYTYAWYSNATSTTVGGSLLVGETADTLDVDNALLGLYIYATVAATNGSGTSTPAFSNIVGPVLEQPLPATNAAIDPATVGDDPEVDIENVTAGWYLRIQRDETGGDYSTPTLDITHLITEHEETTGAIPNTALTPDGYSSPSGAGIQRYRYETDDGRTGPWDEISYNVTVSVNVLSSQDGINRSQYLSGSGAPRLNFIHETGVGAPCMVRGLTEIPGKAHFELLIDGWYNGSDDGLYVGVADSGAVTSFATFLGAAPGAGSIKGCAARLNETSNSLSVSANGTTTSHNLGVNSAVGDYIIVECDPSANTVSFYFWDTSAGALANGGSPIVTKTLTSNIPADWYACGGGRRGTGTASTSDSGTFNFGASAFQMTPSTGYAGW